MKKWISLGLLGYSALTFAQQTDQKNIQIDMGGNKVTFALHNGDRLLFSSEDITFVPAASGKAEAFPLADLQLIRFILDTPDAIDVVVGSDGTHSAAFENGTGRLLLRGFGNEKARIAIYDTSGRLLRGPLYAQGSALSLPDLPDGIYIVRVNRYAFKCKKQ